MRHCLAVSLTLIAACRGPHAPAGGHDDPAGSAAAGAGGPAGRGAGGSTGGGAAGSAATAAGHTADPWASHDAGVVAPKDRKQRAEAAIARAVDIQPKLATLRGLPLAALVPAEYQSTADFKSFVERELAKELPAQKAEAIQAAQLHIGLFTKRLDLTKVMAQTMTSQAAAYYDPASKKFFVVMVPDSDVMLDTISAHELTHALQDRHFDLVKYMPSSLDDDAEIARKFVVEGDATFTMIAYLATATVGADKLAMMMKPLRGQLEQMASMDAAGYADMMKQQAAALPGMDDDMKRSMESMNELPPMIIRPLIDSYMKGALVSLAAFEQGGWKAIDALYTQPPESTEQVLHPATKLLGKRERPRKLTLPSLPGTEQLQEVIGELQWTIYLSQWGVASADAAAGWGGDRYAVMKRVDGTLVGYLATTWDTPKDATEFAAAYVRSLTARFPGADTSRPEAGVARGDRGKVFVRVTGNHVFVVDGADDARELDLLAKGTRIQ